MGGISALLTKIGRSVGGVVGTLYQAGRDTVDTVIRNVIPFMAFISVNGTFVGGLGLTASITVPLLYPGANLIPFGITLPFFISIVLPTLVCIGDCVYNG